LDLRDRVAAALRARLAPRGDVTIKALAAGIGRSGETVRLWLNGAVAIKAEDLAAIVRYLDDPRLLAEIFGDLVQPPAERPLWFTDDGQCREALAGHGEYVRRHLGLPVAAAGDFAAYALRNLGWVEMTFGAALRLRYHGKGVAAGAAGAARAWLLDRAPRIVSVTRSVFVASEWATASGLTVDGVAGELALAAVPDRLRRVASERKSLDLLPVRLRKVLSAWGDSPEAAIRAAAAVGLDGRTSVFSADDAGNVVCQHLGHALRMPRADCEGTNVLAWSDPAYGAELRRALIEARDEGPTYNEIRIPVFGTIRHFDRLTVQVGGNMVTVTELRA
jgi:RimJ/RimL family protein N-acetyltransferase